MEIGFITALQFQKEYFTPIPLPKKKIEIEFLSQNEATNIFERRRFWNIKGPKME